MRTAETLGRPARFLVAALAGLVAATVAGAPARAEGPTTAGGSTAPATTVSADALPTVQVDGVVWSQVVVGDTVYVAGRFANARPAGAAAGTNLTPRGNLLAYDIRTGVLVPGWAPTLNAQALTITASPDGSRIYVGGDFTSVNGETRRRIAALDPATGALVPGFAPAVTASVRAIAVAADTVYVGGDFNAVGSAPRLRLAAFSTAGQLLPWAPSTGVGRNRDGSTAASAAVSSLALTAGQVVVGGRFGSINGTATSGVGAVDAATGIVRPFAIGQRITNQGDDSGVTSLTTDGTTVWLSAYDFSGPGNAEGAIAVRADGGTLVWDADCRGDTYSTFPMGGAVYLASHAHVCSNIGGFPEVTPRVSRFGTALSQAVAGTVGNGTWGNTAFRGAPAPAVMDWYPQLTPGTVTGQGQAGWSVTGTSQYVVYGGEFPRVNGTGQQGLVRFAVRPLAPNKVGPAAGSLAAPTVTATGAGALSVALTTTSDRDDRFLTYELYRDGGATPVASQSVDSLFFKPQTVTLVDRRQAPLSTHSYVVRAVDTTGNSVTSPATSGTVSAEPLPSLYTERVVADGAISAWPLGTVTGGTSPDATGRAPLSVPAAVRPQVTGAVADDASGSFRLDGTSSSRMVASSAGAVRSPSTFSLELWFSTTSTTGGRLAGFGSSASGSNTTYDRHVYLDGSGRVTFGVTSGSRRTVTSPAGLNDGAWHHVVATLGAGGMTLWVDGTQVAANAAVTSASSYNGYWQVGGGPLTSWPGAGRTDLVGSVDAVAVYPTQLTADTIAAHRRTALPNRAPTAAFTSTTTDLSAALDAGASADTDGRVVSWSWDLGDGSSSAGAQVSHDYATPGTYRVTLTVTDDRGAVGTTAQDVVVTRPAVWVLATDAFARTTTGGLGTADTGGAWTTANGASRLSVDGGTAAFGLTAPGNLTAAHLGEVSAASADVSTTVTLTSAPTGGGTSVYVTPRRVGANLEYRVRLRFLTDGTVRAAVTRLAGTATEALVGGEVVVVTGYVPGQALAVDVAAAGSGTTTVTGTVWVAGTTRPEAPSLSRTDDTGALQAPGGVGLAAYLTGSSTAGTVVRFGPLTVTAGA
ncbi:PKD domain-containing protein [Klenkia marina]|uniref:PKD domain-containing protein n=1 Tax=Klenkia marina TaxID=1960309 RepID=A0A1G4XH58_9ACTN|nr:PKD domain-containing protein [Klenkia marina]SCX40028.1 PKD domain-containing protein [Klenkia marina]